MADSKKATSLFVSDATMVAELSPEVAPPTPDGQLFAGRYTLLRELGRGGMGVVYQAQDTMVGDVVALKTLEITGGASESAVERFRREVRLARRITHPNVARTHDLGDFGGRHYLTMEFVEGSDLASVLVRERRLTAVRAAAIAWMVCEGLAAAHAAGVVHRDLKPANILVERSGRVVLTDFGIARALANEGAARTIGSVGTLVYMAPEQVTGESSDPRTDLYAVGLLLFEMLTGELAFTGETPLAAAIARLSAPPPDPRARLAEVPDALAELTLDLLARAPEDRPADAEAVAKRLGAWLESIGETPEKCSAAMATLSASQTSASASALMKAMTRAGSSVGTSQHSTPHGTRGSHTLTRRTPVDMMGRVAVLPMRVLGSAEHGYLGEGIADAILDLLGRTRGVEVASSGAVARFRDDRDPVAVGKGLGVSYVVDGTLQTAGTIVRVSIRLVDVVSGLQLWSGRYDGSLADPFALQDRLSQQISEALRVELVLASYHDVADEETIAIYRHARTQVHGAAGALFDAVTADIDKAIARSPEFRPLQALYPLFNIRGWFVAGESVIKNWEERARASVAEAVRVAGDFPETQLAQAMLAVQDARFRDAVVALRHAIAGAPTFPAALSYLGSLQCEAGRADEGLGRIRQAIDLDPKMPAGIFEFARCSALRGQWDEYRWAVELLRKTVVARAPVLMLEVRVAAWRGQIDKIKALADEIRGEPGSLTAHVLGYANVVLEGTTEGAAGAIQLLSMALNPRFLAMICQITTEAYCLAGEPEGAMEFFLRAADSVLIDLEWTDRCPLLADMRGLPGFVEGRRKVRERVEAIWVS